MAFAQYFANTVLISIEKAPKIKESIWNTWRRTFNLWTSITYFAGASAADGYSLIGKVRSLPREKGGDTPAAAWTAYARDEDRMQALAAGYQMHIAKPIGASQLVTMVAKLAARDG